MSILQTNSISDISLTKGDSFNVEETFGQIGRKVYKFKIILSGNSFVGKTSIFNRFTNETFNEQYYCTIGVEQKIKTLIINEKEKVDMIVWDTAGSEKYHSITRQYYNDTNGILLVFDLTNKKSFENLDFWINDIKEKGSKKSIIFLVGNKIDLEDKREVYQGEIDEFINKNNIISYFEISAKTGFNIIFLFENVAIKLIEMEKNQENVDKSIITNLNKGINLSPYFTCRYKKNINKKKLEKKGFLCC